MKKHIFPYSFRLSLENGKVITFPTINLSLFKRDSDKEFSFLVLVDSGAEVSLLTKSDAELLGFSLKEGKRINIGSVSGDKMSAFLHPIIMKICDRKFKVNIAFSEKDDTPRILGRNPIFSYFFIIFDDDYKKTIFIPRENKEFKDILYS